MNVMIVEWWNDESSAINYIKTRNDITLFITNRIKKKNKDTIGLTAVGKRV